jgi:hypothetical protein
LLKQILGPLKEKLKRESLIFEEEEKKIKEDAKYVGMSSLAKALLEARKKKQEEQKEFINKLQQDD